MVARAGSNIQIGEVWSHTTILQNLSWQPSPVTNKNKVGWDKGDITKDKNKRDDDKNKGAGTDKSKTKNK